MLNRLRGMMNNEESKQPMSMYGDMDGNDFASKSSTGMGMAGLMTGAPTASLLASVYPQHHHNGMEIPSLSTTGGGSRSSASRARSPDGTNNGRDPVVMHIGQHQSRSNSRARSNHAAAAGSGSDNDDDHHGNLNLDIDLGDDDDDDLNNDVPIHEPLSSRRVPAATATRGSVPAPKASSMGGSRASAPASRLPQPGGTRGRTPTATPPPSGIPQPRSRTPTPASRVKNAMADAAAANSRGQPTHSQSVKKVPSGPVREPMARGTARNGRQLPASVIAQSSQSTGKLKQPRR
jgi:hypothetical protein